MSLTSVRSLFFALACGLAVALLANMVYEEPPTGAIEGLVTFAENGRPFAGARVTLTKDPSSMREGEELWVRTVKADEQGRFVFPSVEEGYYTLYVTGESHYDQTLIVHVLEGHVSEPKLVLDPVEPFLEAWSNRSVIPPNEESVVLVSGFTPEEEVEWSIFRLKDDWWKGANSQSLANWVTRQWFVPLGSLPEGTEEVATGRHKVENVDVEGAFTDRISLGHLDEGLYLVRVSAGDLRTYSSVFVSSIAMVTKFDGNTSLFYVSDVTTGEPVAGVQVIDLDAQRTVGKTDSKGTIVQKASRGGDHNYLGLKGRSAAPVYAFSPTSERLVRVFLYTDRPIYRPGETVRFKGIVRELVGRDYRIVSNESVSLQFLDWDSNLLGKQTYVTSGSGTFSGEFALSPEVAPGGLTVEWAVGEVSDSFYVQLADYEKPMYDVSVKPERRGVVSGDSVRFTIEAKYYFGAPAAGKKVTVTVTRREIYWWEREASAFHEDELYYCEGESYDDWVQDFEVTTDENGLATVSLRPEVSDVDERWTVRAIVMDEAGGYGEAEASVDVMRAAVSVVLDQQDYMLSVGQETSLSAVVIDLEGKPIGGAVVVAELQTVDWIRGRLVSHTFARRSFQTDASGIAKIRVTARSTESFRVLVSVQDSEGNKTSEAADYFVYGGEFNVPGGALEVITDKKMYVPGDVCTLAIRAEKPGGAALLTVEGDRLYEHRIVRLDSPITIVKVPVIPAYVPNVDVSVSRINNANYVVARAEILTDPSTRKLTVTVEPERDKVRPGETVPVRIRTSVDGEPVSAEVAFTVVDEAIYAVREDRADILREFYPRKWSKVYTSSSIEEAFLDSGPKDFAPLDIREEFKDTALWLPDVRTDKSGEARVNVTLPDNLTTWRCTAVGATLDTHVGKGTGKITVSLPLSVTVSSPSVVVEGDRFLVEATVTNDTGRSLSVYVSGSAEGAQLDGKNQRLEIENGASRTVQWWATAGSGEAAMVTVSAVSELASDGVVQRIRLIPNGVWEFDTASALTEGSNWSGEVTLSSGRVDLGELSVRISPSIAATLSDSLDSLIDYPYGCAEQTMSRFLPAVLVQGALRGLGLPPPSRARLIPKITDDSLLRLSRMQSSKGGWGWWEGLEPDLYITSLVLEGLYLADARGVALPPWTENGVEWLRSKWSQRQLDLASEDAAYSAYVLSLYDHKTGVAALKSVKADSPTEFAYLALGWRNVGDMRHSQEALEHVKKAARIQGEFALWTGKDYWNSEPTAICSRALIELDPTDPLVVKAVRFLLSQREGAWWRTTRETSYVLLALTKYLERFAIRIEPMEVRVSVNGETVLNRKLSTHQLSKDIVVIIPNAKLKKGKNVVSVERSGGGLALIQATLRELSSSPPKSAPGLYVLRDFYALETVRRPDGSLDQVAGTDPVHDWDVGDVVICRVTVDCDVVGRWVQIDVPIPSNLRVMEAYGESDHGRWTMVWSRNVVSLFTPYLSPGGDVVEIRLRASSRGKALALPAYVYNMYNPTYRAYAPSVELEVGQ